MEKERLHEDRVKKAKQRGISVATLKIEHCQGCIAKCVADICAVKELVDAENGRPSLQEELGELKHQSKNGGLSQDEFERMKELEEFLSAQNKNSVDDTPK